MYPDFEDLSSLEQLLICYASFRMFRLAYDVLLRTLGVSTEVSQDAP